MKNYLELSPEVEKAIVEKRPVVALESTIISHGMPYPQNLETALKVEEIVRSYGAVPATIGIIKGKLKAGLTREELEYFATAKDIVKASRRDLPYITANKMNGATTVASDASGNITINSTNTWRNIKAWKLSELGTINDVIDEVATTTIGTNALAFSSTFAYNDTNDQIDLVWTEIASDGTITYAV